MALTLLHFANTRLGAAFTALGLHGREQRAQLLITLSSLADLAAVEQAQVIVVSGDIFDCAVPAPASLKVVQSFFARLQHLGILAVILPGARDPDGIFDPSCQPDNRDHSPGALVLGPRQPAVRIEEHRLVVRAVPHPAQGEVAAVPRAEPGYCTVGLMYLPDAADLGTIARTFASTGMRYLGIGGDTSFAVAGEADLTVCSPGVPEPQEWGQERGSVAVVHFADDGQVRVERRRTGSRSFARRELVVTTENSKLIRHLIGRLAHGDLALEVVLTGICPADVMIDPAAIEADLAPQFFHLRIVDRTQLAIPSQGAGAWPQGTVLGNFARVMDGRIRDAADEEQAAFDREAYQLGMSMLQGGTAGA